MTVYLCMQRGFIATWDALSRARGISRTRGMHHAERTQRRPEERRYQLVIGWLPEEPRLEQDPPTV